MGIEIRMKSSQANRSKQQIKGMRFMTILMFLLVVAILVKMVDLQLIHHHDNAQRASLLHYSDTIDSPKRGSILTSNGTKLAVTTYAYTIGLTPKDLLSIKDPQIKKADIIQSLSDLLNLPLETVQKAAAQVDKVYVPLVKNVDRPAYEKLKSYMETYDIGGIAINTDFKRQYPEPDLAPEVVGFTNRVDQYIEGVTGLESQYNDLLSGQPGFQYGEVDNYTKSELYFSSTIRQQTENGFDVVTHLNSEIQLALEQELEYVADITNAQKGVVGIVMNPKTGAIYAMGQSGSFDPNQPMAMPKGLVLKSDEEWDPWENKDQTNLLTSKIWLNRAISETYEPGSTYKAITAAVALEEKAVKEDQRFSDLPINVGDWTAYPIKCSIYPLNHGIETMEEGLWHSCNPVFVQVAQHIGISTFYRYVQAFGHLSKTGIDLPAEAVGLNHEKNPNEVDLAVWSFGEQSTLTPISLINSFAAIGNGGSLMMPQVFDYAMNQQGQKVVTSAPKLIRRVISEKTSQKMLDYLRGVVTKGSAPTAEIIGYHVVGKTSTASHGEQDELVDISFCGLLPKEDPELCALVIVYEPTPATTSTAAQYATHQIMKRAARILNIAPNYTAEDYAMLERQISLPNYVGRSLYESRISCSANQMKVFLNEGADKNPWSKTTVAYQYPASGDQVLGDAMIYLSMDANAKEIPTVKVPDFRGLTVDEAMRVAEQAHLNLKKKSGQLSQQILRQSVQPGESISQFSIIELDFSS